MPFKRISRKRKISSLALVPFRHGGRMVRRRTGGVVRRGRFRRHSVQTATSRSLFASNPFRIRARKLRRSAYRRALYNETRFKQHYKTIAATSHLIATPTGSVLQTVYMRPFFTEVDNNVFYKTAGGLQDPGFGQVPSWAGAGIANDPLVVILRGGRLWISVTCSGADVDPIRARVQIIWPKQQQKAFNDGPDSNTIGFPGTASGYLGTAGINPTTDGFAGTNRPISWSLQDAPDYSEYFYPPVYDKTVMLQQNQSMEIFLKVKPNKIDTDAFKRGAGYFPWIVAYLSEQGDRDGAPENITLVHGHNMSFSVTDTLT